MSQKLYGGALLLRSCFPACDSGRFHSGLKRPLAAARSYNKEAIAKSSRPTPSDLIKATTDLRTVLKGVRSPRVRLSDSHIFVVPAKVAKRPQSRDPYAAADGEGTA